LLDRETEEQDKISRDNTCCCPFVLIPTHGTSLTHTLFLRLSYKVGRILPTLPHDRPATVGGILPTLPHGGRWATRSCSLKRPALSTLPHADPGRLSPAAETLSRCPVHRRLLVLPMRPIHVAPTHLRRVLLRHDVDEVQLAAAQVLPRWRLPLSLSGIAPLLALSLYTGDAHDACGVQEAHGHGARRGRAAQLRRSTISRKHHALQ
jgi:hypothetical protein